MKEYFYQSYAASCEGALQFMQVSLVCTVSLLPLQQIVRYHMDHNNHDNIIDTCKRFRNEPYLWVQALTYFAQREEDCKSHLAQVLDQIDEKNLLPPLLVSTERDEL